MRTLLTGAGGYIGLHVVRELLDDGHQVTAVVRSREKLGPFARDPRLKVVETDLVREARIARVVAGHDVCVHAALIWGEPGSELEGLDTAVAVKLFDAADRAGVARCIYISSTAVHRPFAGEMGEEDYLETADVYGATKAAGELFLRAACARDQMTGVVIRPGPVVGPPAFDAGSVRTHNRIAEMVAAAGEGRPIETVRGEGRQLCDVSTVARAIRLLTRAESPHSTYTCVDREIFTWERVAQMVVGCLSSPSDVVVLPSEREGPVPRFRTERIEGLLGGPSDADGALLAHIRHLARTGGAGRHDEGAA